jgi:hypothetical protein
VRSSFFVCLLINLFIVVVVVVIISLFHWPVGRFVGGSLAGGGDQ